MARNSTFTIYVDEPEGGPSTEQQQTPQTSAFSMQIETPMKTMGDWAESRKRKRPSVSFRRDAQDILDGSLDDELPGVHMEEAREVYRLRRDAQNILEDSVDDALPYAHGQQTDGVEAYGTPPASSPRQSPYVTRAQARRSRPDGLCYDQKYHPIDEYIRPKRAAKIKSRYNGGDFHTSEAFSAFRGLFGANVTDADAEVEEDINTDDKEPTMASLTSTKAVRRSARQVNRHVLYIVNMHPQDEELKEWEKPNKKIRFTRDRHIEQRDQEETIQQHDREENIVQHNRKENMEHNYAGDHSHPRGGQPSSFRSGYRPSRHMAESEPSTPQSRNRPSGGTVTEFGIFDFQMTPTSIRLLSPKKTEEPKKKPTKENKKKRNPLEFDIFEESQHLQLTRMADQPHSLDYLRDEDPKENEPIVFEPAVWSPVNRDFSPTPRRARHSGPGYDDQRDTRFESDSLIGSMEEQDGFVGRGTDYEEAYEYGEEYMYQEEDDQVQFLDEELEALRRSEEHVLAEIV
ncbi:hypothetical protein GQ43DRAFT_136253 [Delitschia confertaspora ATCC 74209]|uniref:Uncharacterized protein n=1 Tax=Delitschia confertaspora ATCC 74209 TaxID=1513339 RepID=A0A9P4JUL1_9PLEO|nr:hypothetical protein GQ43DRAFT_136253 [Delitschia confertaspora ATCC 74209]